MKIGSLVIVNSGRYMLKHGVVTRLHLDRGSRGFAEINFVGASGRPLKRNGSSSVPPCECPPFDLVPLPYLNEWFATAVRAAA